MTDFSFETITAAQALAFNAATDTLSFASPLATAGAVKVHFPEIRPGSGDPQTVLISFANITLRFGAGAFGLNAALPDGSHLLVSAYGGRTLTGGDGPDAIFGGFGLDILAGGAGNDTLVDSWQDRLSGGPGADLFVLRHDTVIGSKFFTITDWEPIDRLAFTGVDPTRYVEATLTGDNLLELSRSLLGSNRSHVAAIQRPDGVVVVSWAGGLFDSVSLPGRTLDDVSAANFVTSPLTINPSAPVPGSSGKVFGNMDLAHVRNLNGATIAVATATELRLQGALGETLRLTGTELDYDNNALIGGSVTAITFSDPISTGGAAGYLTVDLETPPIFALNFSDWFPRDATAEAYEWIFRFDDFLTGGAGADLIRGLRGDDRIFGAGGADSLYGGLGNDHIEGGPGANFLRGEEGDDWIVGGDDFDDAHGNMGNDTVSGGAGDDWVVGGKDNDLLYGDAGGDVVWGNLGNDTCDGGDGDDQVRGGQGDDIVRGGSGNDWLSGDRGSDTITGGSGADIFHTFDGAGLDRVTDFNAAEGDRVYLLPGTQFSVAQVGADTVVTVTGAEGGQMVLVGVTLSGLPDGWIFGA